MSGFPAVIVAYECECSANFPWVLGCVHFGTGHLTLRDYRHPSYVEDIDKDAWEDYRYEVFGAVADYGPFIQGYQGDSLTDARASLYTEGERLITRRHVGIATS